MYINIVIYLPTSIRTETTPYQYFPDPYYIQMEGIPAVQNESMSISWHNSLPTTV